MIPDQTNPQNWNGFSYAINNPVRYNDPDGHCAPVCTALLGAFIGAAITGVTYAVNNRGESFNGGELAVAMLGGAVAGGLIGSGLGIVAAGGATTFATFAIGAGTAAAVTEVDYTISNRGNFESRDFVINSTISGAVGGLSAITPLTPLGIATKGLTYVAGAELQYGLQTEKWTKEGAAQAAVYGTIGAATDVLGSYALKKLFITETLLEQTTWPNPKYGPYKALDQAIAARMRTNIVNTASGLLSGTVASGVTHNVQKLLGME